MGFIRVARGQGYFFGYYLEDLVEPDAKCRFVVELVDQLHLDKLYDRYSEKGADAIDPKILLATWFFAYSEGITSRRRLERACRRDTHFIYVSGNLRPDHSTLGRFHQCHRDLFSEYFAEIVGLAVEKDVAGFSSVAIDGSKLQASCSHKQNRDSEQLDKAIESVRQTLAEQLQSCECDEQPENSLSHHDQPTGKETKIKEHKKREELLLKRQQQLDERKKTLKPEHRKNHKINLIEPDAPVMQQVNGDKTRPGYNAQIAVDIPTMLIGSCDVVDDRNDKKQFSRQHQKLNEIVGDNKERQHTADSGYHSLEQLAYIDANGINAVIADPTPDSRATAKQIPSIEKLLAANHPIKQSHFIYHRDEDYYQCPVGKKLELKRTQNHKDHQLKIYEKEGCHACLLAHLCLSPKNRTGKRYLRRDEREGLAEDMYQKLQTAHAKARLKRRAQTVEPVFGIMKESLGFRRFRLRGLSNVRSEFALMCIAYNINRLFVLLGGLWESEKSTSEDAHLFVSTISVILAILQTRIVFNDHEYRRRSKIRDRKKAIR